MNTFFNIIASINKRVVVDSNPIPSTGTIVIGEENYLFPKNDYRTAVEAPDNQLWSQSNMYKNGETYCVFQQNNNPRIGVLRLNQYGVRPIHLTRGNPTIFENHDKPVIRFQGNRMFIVQEDGHDSYPTTIHKAKQDNESLIFDANVDTIPTYPVTYPNIYEYEGKIVIIHQAGTVAAYAINNSLDIQADNWMNPDGTTVTYILEQKADESSRYQPSISNKQFSDDIIFVSCGRGAQLPEPTWFRFNVFRARVNASGYLSYYTIDGRLILEQTTPTGRMAGAHLDMAQYFAIPKEQTGRIPQNTIDSEGNFYSLHENGSNQLMLSYWLINSTTPVNKVITLPDGATLAPVQRSQIGAGALILKVGNAVHIFAKVTVGTRDIIHQYQTTDLGDNWTFVNAIDFGFNVLALKAPDNYGEIPAGQPFMIVAGEASDQVDVTVDLAARKVAFDSLDEVTTNIYDSTTSITETAFNATSILNYSIDADKITKTGTTLNSLIDQSPNANNVVTSGSPTLDNDASPSYVTFDGVNDYISLNPAVLAANQTFLVIAVVDELNGNAVPLTITNNTDGLSYIAPSLQSTHIQTQAAYSNTAGTIKGGDTPLAGFNVCAWLFRGAKHDVPMWLNGKMQDRVVVTVPDFNQEGAYILPNGNTHLEMGRLVRSSTSYYNYRMKHISVHSVNNEKEILERIKFIANKYSIGLLNPYK